MTTRPQATASNRPAATGPTGTVATVAAAAGARPATAVAKTTASAGRSPAKSAAVSRKKPPAPAKPAFRFPRPRLLPVTIFGAVLLLGARVGDVAIALSTGAPVDVVAPTVAHSTVNSGLGPDQERTGDPTPPRPAIATLPGSAPVVPAQSAVVQVAESPPAEKNSGPASPAPAGKPAAASPAAAGNAKSAEAAPSPSPSPSPGPDVEQKFGANDLEVLQKLRERRDQLDERERGLEQREALVQVAEQRLAQKLSELEATRGEIQKLLNQVDSDRQAQLDSLVKIYDTMTPKEAAAIFNEMDEPVLLNVIARMKETKVAPVIAAMNVNRATAITRLLADRKKLPTLPE
jgi:flagellar motility protein MotE (MotC chaperone)